MCAKLNKAFVFPIFTEPVVQGMKSPCFFVEAGSYTEKKYIGVRRNISFNIVITYIPSDGERRRDEGNKMGTALTDLFKFIDIDASPVHCFNKSFQFKNLTRGFNRGFERTDEVLIFKFKVSMFVYDTDTETERMDKLHTNTVEGGKNDSC